MLSWLARVIKGIVIALGFILPGISGGVLAAILGIYERMIGFLAHPFKNFKEKCFVLYSSCHRYASGNRLIFLPD